MPPVWAGEKVSIAEGAKRYWECVREQKRRTRIVRIYRGNPH
jgi:hypothetical protein